MPTLRKHIHKSCQKPILSSGTLQKIIGVNNIYKYETTSAQPVHTPKIIALANLLMSLATASYGRRLSKRILQDNAKSDFELMGFYSPCWNFIKMGVRFT